MAGSRAATRRQRSIRCPAMVWASRSARAMRPHDRPMRSCAVTAWRGRRSANWSVTGLRGRGPAWPRRIRGWRLRGSMLHELAATPKGRRACAPPTRPSSAAELSLFLLAGLLRFLGLLRLALLRFRLQRLRLRAAASAAAGMHVLLPDRLVAVGVDPPRQHKTSPGLAASFCSL